MAGVADSSGYGWAICKALAEAGATVTVGTWPPVLGIFSKNLEKGAFDEDMVLSDGSKFNIAKVSLICRVQLPCTEAVARMCRRMKWSRLGGRGILVLAESKTSLQVYPMEQSWLSIVESPKYLGQNMAPVVMVECTPERNTVDKLLDTKTHGLCPGTSC